MSWFGAIVFAVLVLFDGWLPLSRSCCKVAKTNYYMQSYSSVEVALHAKHGYTVFDNFPLATGLTVTGMIFMNLSVAPKMVYILISWVIVFELLCFALHS